MAAAIGALLRDPDRSHTMGITGGKRAVQGFHESVFLERHLHMIEAVERGEGDRAVDYLATHLAETRFAPDQPRSHV
jgi:DNA-binding GntR family transcriptional regulator